MRDEDKIAYGALGLWIILLLFIILALDQDAPAATLDFDIESPTYMCKAPDGSRYFVEPDGLLWTMKGEPGYPNCILVVDSAGQLHQICANQRVCVGLDPRGRKVL